MRYRPFGSAGWSVSEIGFGAWQVGGDWGGADDAQSIRILHHAFANGINFVDTAQMYGKGRSESVVGGALKAWSGAKIYVATKVQPTVWPDPNDEHAA
ncbi:MAG TPA: aldo/keto reductase, partial [Devosia sp.]|nr:aldo/keto reductase [Devosia sp.]